LETLDHLCQPWAWTSWLGLAPQLGSSTCSWALGWPSLKNKRKNKRK
jgi:hypothetical protein